jgi:leader peptidase (prepilin peptidase)/N-methyltransferase
MLFSPSVSRWPDALLGVLAGAAPLFLIDRITLLVLKKDGFGYGDIKLMAMCGLFLGGRFTLYAFFFAFVTGGLYAAFLLFSGRAKKDSYLAFGPFLALGVMAAVWITRLETVIF